MRTIIALATVLTASVDTLTCLAGPAIAEEGADQLRGQQLNFGVPAAVIAYEQAKTILSQKQLALERKKQMFQLQLATQEDIEKAEKEVSESERQVKLYEELLMRK